jgi:CubicO group peptidase (beta-lactamase class C family)
MSESGTTLLAARPAPDSPLQQTSATSRSDAQDIAAYFDELIPRQMAELHLVGAIVAVVRDGGVAFAKGYGHADLEQRTPVVADRTLFYIGSAGKLFTWTAVMQLVEQG